MARFPLAALLLAGTFLAPGVHAQAPARPPAAPPAAPPPAAAPAPAADPNPVLARVDGQEIRLEEVIAAAAEAMPAELRSVPPQVLRTMLPPEVFNQLLDRAISDRAMVIAARRANVQDDPEFQARMRAFEENALRDTLLRREVLPRLTDEALRARHARDQAAAPEQEEVRARHILVPNEADARAIITQIQGGANFEEVARSRSTDPAGRNGGDLGFFARGDMVPEFANAAFALQPGQLSPNPVRTQFGWHVIRVEERRTSRGPAFEEARDTLRQRMIEEEVNAVIERVRAATTIERVEAPAAPATPAGPIQAVPPPPPARR